MNLKGFYSDSERIMSSRRVSGKHRPFEAEGGTGGNPFLEKPGDRWYALFVMTGEEDRVKERLRFRLRNREFNILVPKRRLREKKQGLWETKIRTLFPGYVLVNGRMEVEDYYSLKGVPGLIKVLKDKSGLLEIADHEIGVIKRLMCNGEIMGSSSILMEGGRIIVTDGPLLGLEGLIQSVDKRKGRAKVRLNFIGESRVVDLSISMVQPA
ncbi:MAG: antiterminator LoaP [Clostridiales bacterium]|jgi:transcriptional antiterminator NusG|nr:antiterminator LoaP [Eubacteriales bacterium]MDH7566514.1 antiterminator LoaP [Clostridiales bacterium]